MTLVSISILSALLDSRGTDHTHVPGMSTANMKLVVLDVPLEGDMELPDQNLEDGEAIVRRAIELRSLNTELKGKQPSACLCTLTGYISSPSPYRI